MNPIVGSVKDEPELNAEPILERSPSPQYVEIEIQPQVKSSIDVSLNNINRVAKAQVAQENNAPVKRPESSNPVKHTNQSPKELLLD